VVIAHYSIIDVDGGAYSEKRIGVKGREHNAVGVEKDFTIVLWQDVTNIDNKREYVYKLETDGTTTTKVPPFIKEYLKAEEIPNDITLVLEAIRAQLTNK
jgi:hypothetical protein